MRGADPRALIVQDLTGEHDTSAREAAAQQAGGRQSHVAYTSQGGEARGANRDSVTIDKENERDGYRLYGVRWRAGDGAYWSGVFDAQRQQDGDWDVHRGHYGGGGPGPDDDLRRGRPWVNLGSGGRPLYFGGRVCEAPAAKRVRMVLGDHAFEDDIDESRWVLFPTDLPNETIFDAWVVEIYDQRGALLARHRAGGRAEPV